MPIRKDQGETRRKVSDPKTKRPPDAPRITPPLMDQWWKEWQAREGFHRPMSIEDREFRGSWAAIRCDRALWYSVNGEPESNPTGASGHWRMAAGSLIHILLDDVIVKAALVGDNQYAEIIPEMALDLRRISINGASSADLVVLDHKAKTGICVELKSKGGYKFKLCTMDWKGGPTGPEYADVVQAVLATEALRETYPTYKIECRVMYLSLENISEQLASKNGISEYGKFSAEWVITEDECALVLDRERARINRVLTDPFVPQRVIDDVDGQMPVRRMLVTDIDKGALQGDLDGGIVYGSTWRCGYCRFKERCRADG